MATKLSQFLTVYKGPTKKAKKLKPTGKVVKFQFRKNKNIRPLELRFRKVGST